MEALLTMITISDSFNYDDITISDIVDRNISQLFNIKQTVTYTNTAYFPTKVFSFPLILIRILGNYLISIKYWLPKPEVLQLQM